MSLENHRQSCINNKSLKAYTLKIIFVMLKTIQYQQTEYEISLVLVLVKKFFFSYK